MEGDQDLGSSSLDSSVSTDEDDSSGFKTPSPPSTPTIHQHARRIQHSFRSNHQEQHHFSSSSRHNAAAAVSSSHDSMPWGPFYDSVTTLLESNRKLTESFEHLSERVTRLEQHLKLQEDASNLQNFSCPDEAPPSGTCKQKKLCRKLTKMVATIHENLSDDCKFNLSEKLSNNNNAKVKKAIFQKIMSTKFHKYSALEINKAIKRHFESKRRSWREKEAEDPAQILRVQQQSINRRRRSRKSNLYDRRKNAVLPGEEFEKFKAITIHYMSEQYSSEDEAYTVHRPIWRSEALTQFLGDLDKRADEKKSTERYRTKRHRRRLGTPMKSEPPKDAPMWTINPDWLKDRIQAVSQQEQGLA